MTASSPDYEFDAEISFLSGDLPLALELQSLLVPAVNTFVYARNQETVGATDGMDSLRSVYRDRARLSIVLYRQCRGQTPWTGVEEIAIRDRCLATKFRSLVVASIDGSPMPSWVPDTYLHFELQDYSLAELAGIVKSRLRELGGEVKRVTAMDLARQKVNEEAFRVETARYFDSPEGIAAADASAQDAMRVFCESAGQLRNEAVGWIPHSGYNIMEAVARLGHASVQILWRRKYNNSLRESVLRIRGFEGGVAIPGRSEYNGIGLREISGEAFEVMRTRGQDLRWQPTGGGRALTSEELGQHAALRLIEEAQAHAGPRPIR